MTLDRTRLRDLLAQERERGILMTPFHNMALISPATSEADIDEHTRVFRESVDRLFS